MTVQVSIPYIQDDGCHVFPFKKSSCVLDSREMQQNTQEQNVLYTDESTGEVL